MTREATMAFSVPVKLHDVPGFVKVVFTSMETAADVREAVAAKFNLSARDAANLVFVTLSVDDMRSLDDFPGARITKTPLVFPTGSSAFADGRGIIAEQRGELRHN